MPLLSRRALLATATAPSLPLTAARAQRPTLKIGVLTDMAGPYQDIVGPIRTDGRKLHPSHLFQVKKPSESKGPWDYYKVMATTPSEEAFRPIKDGACPLIKA